ncbi:MAG TPA: amidohydrolase family protein [Candidatus Saccharimonadales bacterium]
MIIDCHSHLGRNEHINANVNQLLESMDQAKIERALVFAGELNNINTSELLKEISPHTDRLHAVASWDFSFDNWTDPYNKYGINAIGKRQETILASLYQQGAITAVKFYTGYYHHMPGDREIRNALSALNKVGCPAIFHMGDCLNSVKKAKLKYAQPLLIDEVAVDFPNMNFIIAHMGYPWVLDAAEVCFKNENVFSDISGYVYGSFSKEDQDKFVKTLKIFNDIAGSDKLLFGTDWPISNQRSYIETLDDLSDKEFISDLFKPETLTKNVIKAFKLEVPNE